MYYEINVSLNGVHFFATDERSITNPAKLELVYPVLKSKFPESGGFKVSVTSWDKKGKEIDMNEKTNY